MFAFVQVAGKCKCLTFKNFFKKRSQMISEWWFIFLLVNQLTDKLFQHYYRAPKGELCLFNKE